MQEECAGKHGYLILQRFPVPKNKRVLPPLVRKLFSGVSVKRHELSLVVQNELYDTLPPVLYFPTLQGGRGRGNSLPVKACLEQQNPHPVALLGVSI